MLLSRYVSKSWPHLQLNLFEMREGFGKILYHVVTKLWRILRRNSVTKLSCGRLLSQNSVTKLNGDRWLWPTSVTNCVTNCDGIRHNPKNKTFPLNFPSKLWRKIPSQFKFFYRNFRHNIFLTAMVRHNFPSHKIVTDVLPSQLKLWPIGFWRTVFRHNFRHNSCIFVTISTFFRHNSALFS